MTIVQSDHHLNIFFVITVIENVFLGLTLFPYIGSRIFLVLYKFLSEAVNVSHDVSARFLSSHHVEGIFSHQVEGGCSRLHVCHSFYFCYCCHSYLWQKLISLKGVQFNFYLDYIVQLRLNYIEAKVKKRWKLCRKNLLKMPKLASFWGTTYHFVFKQTGM